MGTRVRPGSRRFSGRRRRPSEKSIQVVAPELDIRDPTRRSAAETGEGATAIAREQLAVLVSLVPAAVVASTVKAAIVAWLLSDVMESRDLVPWGVALAAALIAQLGLGSAARRFARERPDPRPGFVIVALGFGATGLVWAFLVLEMPDVTTFDSGPFVIFMIGGVMAAAMILSSPHLPTALAHDLPIVAALAFSFATADGPGSMSLAALVPLYFLLLAGAGYWQQKAFLRSVALEKDNARLARLLRRERDGAREAWARSAEAERSFRTLAEQAPLGIARLGPDGSLQYANPALREMLGAVDDAEVAAKLAALLEDCDEPPLGTRERIVGRVDGEERELMITGAPLFGAWGEDRGQILCVNDVTELARATAAIDRLAHHDVLTGLANRSLFQKELASALSAAGRGGQRIGLLLIDVDGFGRINETLGQPVGDALLEQIAARLAGRVRSRDLIARLGGDEFGVLLRRVTSIDAARETSERLLAEFERSFRIDGHELYLNASLGLAVYPEDACSARELQTFAGLALRRAKSRPGTVLCVFDRDLHAEFCERTRLKQQLHGALRDGQFEVHLQPQVGSLDGEVVGVETLVRWRHPERGLLAPGCFLSLIEDSDLLVPFTLECFRLACHALHRLGDRVPHVAVNLSPLALRHHGLVAGIGELLRREGVPPTRIEVEITESAVLDTDKAMRALAELRGLGLRIAIDDFGTGYSCLTRLKDLEVAVIKIDRGFIAEMLEKSDVRALVEAIVGIGRTLGLDVVAEGVETEEQAALLARMGCTSLQGFLFARPLELPVFERWLEERAGSLRATGGPGGSPSPGDSRARPSPDPDVLPAG